MPDWTPRVNPVPITDEVYSGSGNDDTKEVIDVNGSTEVQWSVMSSGIQPAQFNRTSYVPFSIEELLTIDEADAMDDTLSDHEDD